MGQIEDLRLFASVIDHGSISGAANDMHIAKSAVSRRLSLLEERYGAKLVIRERGRWDITNIGKELYQRAQRVIGDMDDIEADFRNETYNLKGSLSVSIPIEFGLLFLKEPLSDFALRYPDIQLSINFENRIIDLDHENYDFAIRITRTPQKGVAAKKIGEMSRKLYASKAYLDKHGTPQTVEDLNDHRLLAYGLFKKMEWLFKDKDGKETLFPFAPYLNTNSGEFLTAALCKHGGIARLPNFVGDPFVETGELVEVLPDFSYFRLSIYIAHAENRRLNKRMRIFAEEMEKACFGI